MAEKFDISANDIKLTDHFIDDLHGDSLDSVEIVQDTEEAFNIEITDEELEKNSNCRWSCKHCRK